MASKIGFKRLIIRILDKKNPTPGENVFTVEGKTDKGATQTAKINGLSSEPVKTYGSDVAYYISRKGVGDVTVDLDLLDIPEDVIDKILGYKQVDGITVVGENTIAPDCSIILETKTPDGKVFAYGFFKGVFSKDGEELGTLEGKQKELSAESFVFTASAGEDGDYEGVYMAKVVGDTDEKYKKLKKALKIEEGV